MYSFPFRNIFHPDNRHPATFMAQKSTHWFGIIKIITNKWVQFGYSNSVPRSVNCLSLIIIHHDINVIKIDAEYKSKTTVTFSKSLILSLGYITIKKPFALYNVNYTRQMDTFWTLKSPEYIQFVLFLFKDAFVISLQLYCAIY